RAWLAWRGLPDDEAAQPTAAPAAVQAAPPQKRALDPEEAAGAVGHTVTVEMTIASVGENRAAKWLYLNSGSGPQDPGNFALAIPQGTPGRRKSRGLDCPDADLVGRRVRGTGPVSEWRDKPQIIIERPEQLQLLEP